MKAIHLKTLLIVFILLGMISCNSIRFNKSTRPDNGDELHYSSKFVQIDSDNVSIYECEKFVLSAMENYSIESIQQEYKFLKCAQSPEINLHNPAIVDTIYTFSNKKNRIRIYRSLHKDIIFMLDVTSSKFKFTGDIRPGMSKAAFIQTFGITELIDDKVQLINSEGTMRFTFYFKRNSLKRITANLYFD